MAVRIINMLQVEWPRNQSSIPSKHGQTSFARHLDRLRSSQNDPSHRCNRSVPGVKRLRVKAGLSLLRSVKDKNELP